MCRHARDMLHPMRESCYKCVISITIISAALLSSSSKKLIYIQRIVYVTMKCA